MDWTSLFLSLSKSKAPFLKNPNPIKASEKITKAKQPPSSHIIIGASSDNSGCLPCLSKVCSSRRWRSLVAVIVESMLQPSLSLSLEKNVEYH
ncbi:hypothetical protein HN51_036739 [Arachis hypogaea]